MTDVSERALMVLEMMAAGYGGQEHGLVQSMVAVYRRTADRGIRHHFYVEELAQLESMGLLERLPLDLGSAWALYLMAAGSEDREGGERIAARLANKEPGTIRWVWSHEPLVQYQEEWRLAEEEIDERAQRLLLAEARRLKLVGPWYYGGVEKSEKPPRKTLLLIPAPGLPPQLRMPFPPHLL